jgi:hypothetical protein
LHSGTHLAGCQGAQDPAPVASAQTVRSSPGGQRSSPGGQRSSPGGQRSSPGGQGVAGVPGRVVAAWRRVGEGQPQAHPVPRGRQGAAAAHQSPAGEAGPADPPGVPWAQTAVAVASPCLGQGAARWRRPRCPHRRCRWPTTGQSRSDSTPHRVSHGRPAASAKTTKRTWTSATTTFGPSAGCVSELGPWHRCTPGVPRAAACQGRRPPPASCGPPPPRAPSAFSRRTRALGNHGSPTAHARTHNHFQTHWGKRMNPGGAAAGGGPQAGVPPRPCPVRWGQCGPLHRHPTLAAAGTGSPTRSALHPPQNHCHHNNKRHAGGGVHSAHTFLLGQRVRHWPSH